MMSALAALELENFKHLSCWHLYRSLFAICISLYFTVSLGLKCTLKLSWIHKASTIKIHAQSETLQNFNEAITKFKVELAALCYFVMKVLCSPAQVERTAAAPVISKHGRHAEPTSPCGILTEVKVTLEMNLTCWTQCF